MDDGAQYFTFDRVFGPDSTQSDVFDFVAEPIVRGRCAFYTIEPTDIMVLCYEAYKHIGRFKFFVSLLSYFIVPVVGSPIPTSRRCAYPA
jgi:hypothetical protein